MDAEDLEGLAHPGIDLAASMYRGGFDHAGELMRQGLHPDAIRFRLHGVELRSDRPFPPTCWRAIEDALAGRPCTP